MSRRLLGLGPEFGGPGGRPAGEGPFTPRQPAPSVGTPFRGRPMSKIHPRFLAGLLVLALTAGSGLVWIAVLQPETGDQLRSRLQAQWPWLASDGLSQDSALGAVSVRLDPAASGRPISPLIYGVAAADPDVVRALGATVDRSGGNPASRYN